MVKVGKEDPDTMSPDNFVEAYFFLSEYVKKVILLPGHIERWNTLVDFDNIGMTSLPKDEIVAFGRICQAHVLYFLKKSYYVHVGWGQRLAENRFCPKCVKFFKFNIASL